MIDSEKEYRLYQEANNDYKVKCRYSKCKADLRLIYIYCPYCGGGGKEEE